MKGKTAATSGRRPLHLSRDDLLVATLAQLAADDDRLQAFFAETGQSPADLRQGLARGSVQIGLLDYLVNNDDLIVAVAGALGRSPEDVAASALRAVRPDESATYF